MGEVFEAEWEGVDGTTKLVSEQVSHHPPVTACRLWNEDAGVEVSFSLGLCAGRRYIDNMMVRPKVSLVKKSPSPGA